MCVYTHAHAHTMWVQGSGLEQLLRQANHCNSSCNLSSAQETARVHASPWWCLCGHDVVICLNAGPIQFVYGSHSLRPLRKMILPKILFPSFLCHGGKFPTYVYVYIHIYIHLYMYTHIYIYMYTSVFEMPWHSIWLHEKKYPVPWPTSQNNYYDLSPGRDFSGHWILCFKGFGKTNVL